MQAHGDDHHAGNRRQDRQCLPESLPEGGGSGTESGEDDAEAKDEEQRSHGDAALHRRALGVAAVAQLIEARAAHIGEIGRHQGQHAGAEKTQHAGAEHQWQREFHEADAPSPPLLAGGAHKAMRHRRRSAACDGLFTPRSRLATAGPLPYFYRREPMMSSRLRSQGGVQFPTGGKAATPSPRAPGFCRGQQIRCDSGADGIVRMKENGMER